jgi:hypothetical protein
MTHRWMKFWPQDWEGDVALRVVSLSAQGLWMRLVCAMHRSEPYGHLTMNGRPMSVRQVASLASISEREAKKLLDELEKAGVFSRTEDGVIFSRRLVRDRAVSEAGRQNGKAGGNPNLKPKVPDRISGGVNPPLNGGPNLLEAEAEAETEKIFSLRSNISRARQARAADTQPKGFAEFWQHYPAKVGKGAALKAWPKAVREAGGDPSEIVIALKARLHLFNPEFVPNPATWLNQRRWEDDPETLLSRQARSA